MVGGGGRDSEERGGGEARDALEVARAGGCEGLRHRIKLLLVVSQSLLNLGHRGWYFLACGLEYRWDLGSVLAPGGRDRE